MTCLPSSLFAEHVCISPGMSYQLPYTLLHNILHCKIRAIYTQCYSDDFDNNRVYDNLKNTALIDVPFSGAYWACHIGCLAYCSQMYYTAKLRTIYRYHFGDNR